MTDRRRAGAVVASLLALLAVVALVASGHRGASGGPLSPRRPSSTVLSYAISTYLVLGALMAILFAILLVTQRERLPAPKRHGPLRSIVYFALVLAAVFAIFSTRHLHNVLHRLVSVTPPAAHLGRKGGSHGKNAPAPQPHFTWVPLAVIASLAVLGTAYLVTRRRPSSRRERLPLAEEVGQALDEALDDLRAERDPRRAIIAAYARMERLLAAHGLPRQAYEAPFEFLARVLIDLRASSGSVFELTHLFERAKFSGHDLGPELKDEAIDALVAVREELRQAA